MLRDLLYIFSFHQGRLYLFSLSLKPLYSDRIIIKHTVPNHSVLVNSLLFFALRILSHALSALLTSVPTIQQREWVRVPFPLPNILSPHPHLYLSLDWVPFLSLHVCLPACQPSFPSTESQAELKAPMGSSIMRREGDFREEMLLWWLRGFKERC